MIDITAIVEAVIALCVALVTAFVVPWVKRKLGEQGTEELLKWVAIAVNAAEQLYDSTDGKEKKLYVLQFLHEKGIKADGNTIDAAIEAAVLELHTSLYGAELTEPVEEDTSFPPVTIGFGAYADDNATLEEDEEE